MVAPGDLFHTMPISKLVFLLTIFSFRTFLGSAFVPNGLHPRALCRTPLKVPHLYTMPDPESMNLSSMLVSEKDYGELFKTAAIVVTLGGGLIPATISANSAMFKTLSGKKDAQEEIANAKPGESFDPTIGETKYRRYVDDSGAEGPLLPFSSLLFAAEKIPLVDIIAILGRIESVDSIADWSNLPSTRLPNVSKTDPPQWLPRRAFKVNVRKAKFKGWPNDPKTGQPIGGEDLKAAALPSISKKDPLIGDAALDAVFDTWAWGASIATPDKVSATLKLFKKSPSEVDLGAFVGAAVRGRSATGIAALTFIVIQITVYGSLFVAPALRFFFDIDLGFGALGKQ